jgi:beta-glucosidase
VEQLPPFEDYNMRGRTYRYFEGEPLFPFGYGLSYTNFAYSNLIIDEEIKAGEIIKVAVDVSNRGKIAGDEVVQLYVKNLDTTVPTPIHSLQGFKRINLKPGETRRVEFLLQPRQLAVIKDQDMLNSENESSRKVQYIVEPGAYEISVGGMQPVTISETTQIISKKIKIIGESYLIK